MPGSYKLSKQLEFDASIENVFYRYYLDAISASTAPIARTNNPLVADYEVLTRTAFRSRGI